MAKVGKFIYSSENSRLAREAEQKFVESYGGGLFGVVKNDTLLDIRFKNNLEATAYARENDAVAVYVPSAIKYYKSEGSKDNTKEAMKENSPSKQHASFDSIISNAQKRAEAQAKSDTKAPAKEMEVQDDLSR